MIERKEKEKESERERERERERESDKVRDIEQGHENASGSTVWPARIFGNKTNHTMRLVENCEREKGRERAIAYANESSEKENACLLPFFPLQIWKKEKNVKQNRFSRQLKKLECWFNWQGLTYKTSWARERETAYAFACTSSFDVAVYHGNHNTGMTQSAKNVLATGSSFTKLSVLVSAVVYWHRTSG